MFTGVKQILPVHEFHMLFKILVYNGCILAQFVACSAVNVRDMSSRPATYTEVIFYFYTWFVPF